MRHPKTVAEAMKELAIEDPGILYPYFARVNARGGPTSLFSLAPNPLLDHMAALPIRVPFHSIIGDRGLAAGPGVPTALCRIAARIWLEPNPKRSYLLVTAFFRKNL